MDNTTVDQSCYFQIISSKITKHGESKVIFYNFSEDPKSDRNRIFDVDVDNQGEVTPDSFSSVMQAANIFALGPLVKTYDGSVQVSFIDRTRPTYKEKTKNGYVSYTPNIVQSFIDNNLTDDNASYKTPTHYNEGLWCFRGLSVDDTCSLISYIWNKFNRNPESQDFICQKTILTALRMSSRVKYDFMDRINSQFSSFLSHARWHQTDIVVQQIFNKIKKNSKDSLQKNISSFDTHLFNIFSIDVTNFITPCANTEGTWTGTFAIYFTPHHYYGAKMELTVFSKKPNGDITLTMCFSSNEDDNIEEEIKIANNKYETKEIALDVKKFNTFTKMTDNYLPQNFDLVQFTNFINNFIIKLGILLPKSLPREGLIKFIKPEDEDDEEEKDNTYKVYNFEPCGKRNQDEDNYFFSKTEEIDD